MHRNFPFHSKPDNMKQSKSAIPPLVISSPKTQSELTTERLMKILESLDDQLSNHNKRISLIEKQITYWNEISRC